MRGADTSLGGARRDLPETVSDLVSRAGDSSPQIRHEALEQLCGRYWKPVYFYIRTSWAKSNEDAKDLTQAFFLSLVENNVLRDYVPARASFRTFLKLLLSHFLQNQDKALHRLKRGGGIHLVELDGDLASWGEILVDSAAPDPEKAFDIAWKESLVTRGVDRVRKRILSSAQPIRFLVYEAYELSPAPGHPTYATVAAKLGIKESDVINHLAAAREEIRKEIRAELAGMTSSRQELEEEWNVIVRA